MRDKTGTDNRFSMLRVYQDGRRIVESRGLTYAQCTNGKLYPFGGQTDKTGKFIYSHVLTETL